MSNHLGNNEVPLAIEAILVAQRSLPDCYIVNGGKACAVVCVHITINHVLGHWKIQGRDGEV